MGPSGAGKSSLLNVLAGRIAPSATARIAGSITLGGQSIDPVANRQNIAYVMQDDALLPTVSPREALTLSAALRIKEEVRSFSSFLSNHIRFQVVIRLLELN